MIASLLRAGSRSSLNNSSSSSPSSPSISPRSSARPPPQPSSSAPRVTHVIFDLDGLLLDTEWAYELATRQVLRQFPGKEEQFMATGLRQRIMGRKALDIATMIVEELELPISPQEFLKQRTPLLQEHLPQCKAMPGAIELVTHLHLNGIPMAVATSSNADNFGLKTHNRSWWFAMFDNCVKGDDPELFRGKPAPDIFLLAAKRLGCTTPETCLVFEDAAAGVEAASAAKMQVIWVPGGDTPRAPETCGLASQVLGSLLEFDPTRWNLPPWEGSLSIPEPTLSPHTPSTASTETSSPTACDNNNNNNNNNTEVGLPS